MRRCGSCSSGNGLESDCDTSRGTQQISLREHDRDRYGRIVGEVFGHAGQSLNLALVEAGKAAAYPRYCRDSRYFDAQIRAKAARWGQRRQKPPRPVLDELAAIRR